eukprot:3380250-Rhodomonas_salina.2
MGVCILVWRETWGLTRGAGISEEMVRLGSFRTGKVSIRVTLVAAACPNLSRWALWLSSGVQVEGDHAEARHHPEGELVASRSAGAFPRKRQRCGWFVCRVSQDARVS